MDWQGVAALATALGLGAVLRDLVKGLIQHFTGKAERDRSALIHALEERDAAYRREVFARRRTAVMAEHASRLRRMLIENGFPEENLPAWPASPKRPDDD